MLIGNLIIQKPIMIRTIIVLLYRKNKSKSNTEQSLIVLGQFISVIFIKTLNNNEWVEVTVRRA